MKKTKLLILLLSLSLASCTWVGTQKQVRVFNRENAIDTQSSFYLNYPKNGFEKAFLTRKLEVNPYSAQEVVETLRGFLSEKIGQLTINDRNLNLEEAFKQASLRDSRYLIDVEIAQWKDASYFMCSAPQNPNGQFNEPMSQDALDLTIFVYDVKTKKLLNKQKISNQGCPIVLLGIIPIGKNSPSSRLSSMLGDWMNSVK